MEWRRGHVIGRGSSATVSIATSSYSDHVFAAKSTELSQAEFLQREQQILSILQSPYVVGYIGHDITRENNKLIYNLFMEYVPGGTLADAIRKNGGQLIESAIGYYTHQILFGLEYLHSIGIAHCDIKSQNILISESGAKLTDFGCAKWQGDNVDVASQIGGTPMFMAPEVARGEYQGFHSDVWALGCTVIEMATGLSPWPDQTDHVSVLYKIAYSGESPEIPCFLSIEARDFLSKCLVRDARERWTVEQLLDHPFIVQSEKQSDEFDFISNFNTPTSIIDQGVWNSMMETETPCSMIRIDGEDPQLERIERLVTSRAEPMWAWEENWNTIRSNNSVELMDFR